MTSIFAGCLVLLEDVSKALMGDSLGVSLKPSTPNAIEEPHA
jgi:hypothetical protein